ADVTGRERMLAVRTQLDEPNGILVAIEDSGTGIEQSNMDRIFESFFTTKPSGMGMGLSICRSIVQAHGGRLWASARTPEGSVFHVRLPTNSWASFNSRQRIALGRYHDLVDCQGADMRRRELIGLIGCVSTWPIWAAAQPGGKVWRVGFLTPRSRPIPPGRHAFSDAFLQGMNGLGYSAGNNLVMDWRSSDGNYQRLAGLAADLAGMNLPVIVAYGTAAARALQKATKSTPIVVAAALDLVGAGIVASLARPGGNITGLSVIDVDISAKQLE